MSENNTEECISIVSSDFEKHFFFHGMIDKSSAFKICTNLTALDLEIKEKEQEKCVGFAACRTEDEEKNCNPDFRIILHLNCPGGLVSSAFMVADTIETLSTPVDCIVEGNLASAGIILLLACEKRTMNRHSKIYFHETVHCADSIKYYELSSFWKESNEINKMLKEYYKEKTNLSIATISKILRQEKAISPEEALEYGFINIPAGSSLS